MDASYYAEYYDVEESHWWFRARRRILRAVLEDAGLWGRGLRVLDLGCGTGRMLEFLAGGMTVIGLDADTNALRFATKRGIDRLVQADATCLPVASASVDLVTAFDVVEHLADDVGALAEMRRVVRPGGHCLVTVPAFRWLWSQHDEINHHVRRYRRRDLERQMGEAGFRLVRATYFNALLFGPVVVVRLGRKLATAAARPRRASAVTARSDFAMFPSSRLGRLLESVMGWEAGLLSRVDLPVGVSILGLGVRADG